MEEKDEREYKGHDVSISRYYHELICKLTSVDFPMLSIHREMVIEKYKKDHVFSLIELGYLIKESQKLNEVLTEMTKSPNDQYQEYLKWKENRKKEIDLLVKMYLDNIFDLSMSDAYLTIYNKTTGENANLRATDIEGFKKYLDSLK